MLIDSHCHLDFPDFAAEIDAVVARARAAGVGRLVTISTRVRKHAQVLAIAERFPDVFCSIGTHPHHAHERRHLTANPDFLVQLRPNLADGGLDYEDFQIRAAQHLANNP